MTDTIVPEKDVRVSRITKTIKRTYNVAQYESLEVAVSFDEEVTWSDIEERDKKTNNLTKLLICDLYETSLNTMQLLEIDGYRAKLEKIKLKQYVDEKLSKRSIEQG